MRDFRVQVPGEPTAELRAAMIRRGWIVGDVRATGLGNWEAFGYDVFIGAVNENDAVGEVAAVIGVKPASLRVALQ